MDKKNAIKAMEEGSKVTHMYFSPEEWMTITNGMYEFEDGCFCDFDEFWAYREEAEWSDDWKIYPANKNTP